MKTRPARKQDKGRHPKKLVHRLSRHYRDRINAVARRLDMGRPEIEKFVSSRFGCKSIELAPEQAIEVIARLDRLFTDRQAERARLEEERAARLAREEAERAENERERIKQLRADRKARVNRSKKAAKYRRLGKEFKQ